MFKMTAEEARKRTEDKLIKEVETYNVDFESIFQCIDWDIERAIDEGKFEAYVMVDGCDESWECVYYKRDKIIEHYKELGYNIENHGYDRCITSDTFTINWK